MFAALSDPDLPEFDLDIRVRRSCRSAGLALRWSATSETELGVPLSDLNNLIVGHYGNADIAVRAAVVMALVGRVHKPSNRYPLPYPRLIRASAYVTEPFGPIVILTLSLFQAPKFMKT